MPIARIMNQFALCMTGISGSGKTTLANAVSKQLKNRGIAVEVIDGDETRGLLGGLFGYNKEGRLKMSLVNQAIGFYLLRNHINFILSVVAPYEEIRAKFREFFGDAYIQVYVKASVETCAKRDVKGLYKMSREGLIENLNGSNDVFETPENSELIIDTENASVDGECDMVVEYLCRKGYIHF